MFVFGFLLHIASGSEYYDLANAFIVFSINLNYLNKFKGKKLYYNGREKNPFFFHPTEAQAE